MVNTKELRIGNWIDIGGHYANVGGVTSDEVLQTWNGNLSSINVEPIPLTPELLTKAGFYHGHKDGWLVSDNEGMSLVHVDTPNQGLAFAWNIYNPSEVIVKHLHQLQNLYFALTGKELEINPND